MTRSARWATRIGMVWLIASGVAPPNGDDRAYAQLRRWSVEATVLEIVDPDQVFRDVRIGDNVRGALRYSLATEPEAAEPGVTAYSHAPWFSMISMAIENPRLGKTTEFAVANEGDGSYADVLVFDDYDPFNTGELFDSLFAVKSVTPPLGFDAAFPSVSISLIGPATTLTGSSLPAQLDLDDWQDAVILFGDPLDEAGKYGSILSEINAITPLAAGDFNQDGIVDAADLAAWQHEFGAERGTLADADGDGDADGDDFLLWQRELRAADEAESFLVAAPSVAVPEPNPLSSSTLILIGLCLRTHGRRSRAVEGGPVPRGPDAFVASRPEADSSSGVNPPVAVSMACGERGRRAATEAWAAARRWRGR